MKKFSIFLALTVLLTACGGPKTVRYGNAMLTYDSGVWETFDNELASGLGVKGDESCWVDLKGDLTTPRADEALAQATEGAVTLYSSPDDGSVQYLSFQIGTQTVYGRVSVESPDTCVGNLMGLASSSLGE